MTARAIMSEAERVLELISIDPLGLGGVVLRGPSGPQRDVWLEQLKRCQPSENPWRKIPVHVDDDRLLGGLDVAASLSAGRPIVASGILAEADNGFVILPMAERFPRCTAARICAVLDRGEVHVERDGISRSLPACFGLIALDESLEENDSEFLSPDLEDRLAFQIFSDQAEASESVGNKNHRVRLKRAQKALSQVRADKQDMETLCGAAAALGISSLRAVALALRAAKASAALNGRNHVAREDIELAVRLVLAHRANHWPQPADDQAQAPPPQEDQNEDSQKAPQQQEIPQDLVLEAVRSTLPPGLLARMQAIAQLRRAKGARGRFGPAANSQSRGRPIGVRKGLPRSGQRLHVGATLKAAAPWQRLRARPDPGADASRRAQLSILPEDFHVSRFKSRRESTTIFVVDASGSAAAQRLAEAKGAVELLLAECYVRRDQVALIAFRGQEAELLLSPTRALARARRELAALPGGGGTPLAAGIDTARELAQDLQRRGRQPVIVLMTDGRANIARDGTPGHERANEEALAAAQLLKIQGWSCLVVDTSNRPRPKAREVADAMGAQYLPLPQADAQSLSSVVGETMRASQ